MEPLISDKWVKCISTKGNIRGVAVRATQVAQHLAQIHGLKGFAAQAMGETAMGALLVASFCKGGEKVNLNIRGSGQIRQALADSATDGTVRGYVVQRESAPDLSPEYGPWGEGLLAILRTKKSEGEQPYIGTVPLVTGHLAKDLTFYWLQSEQIPSAVGLAVSMDGDQVRAAGGFLIQALPGATSEEIATIEKHLSEIHSYAKSISEDADPLHLLSQVFQDLSFVLLEEKPIQFQCNCSWERVLRALALTGVEELQSMADENHGAEVRCDFCAKVYQVEQAKLREMIAQATSS